MLAECFGGCLPTKRFSGSGVEGVATALISSELQCDRSVPVGSFDVVDKSIYDTCMAYLNNSSKASDVDSSISTLVVHLR